MVHPFESTRSAADHRVGGTALSVVLHLALITAATAASGRQVPIIHVSAGDVAERLLFVDPVRLLETAARGGRAQRGATRQRAVRRALPDFAAIHAAITAPIDVPTTTVDVTPEMDYGNVAANSIAYGDGMGDALQRMLKHAYARPDGSGAYSADIVEKVVWPHQDNPSPVYPRALLSAGIETSFRVRFVVDSTGRADLKSLVFPDDVHELFMKAIRVALSRSRYYPAELGGRPVSQLVEQDFRFHVER